MKKRWLSAALCTAMVAGSLAGCGLKSPETTTTAAATEAAKEEATTAAEAKEESKGESAAAGEPVGPAVTLVMAEVNPLDTIVGQTDTAFKEKVEELSGGSITVDLQASGVLGSENDVLDTMLGGGGTIDMSRISAFALTSYGAQKSVLLSVPYTFVNREHFWKFADSELAPEFLMEPHDNGLGVRGLFYGEEGFRHFFFKEEANTLEDLKGLKIRVSNDPVMTGMVAGLGANATVVSMNELYSALQTGVVDAAEQPIANYASNAFPEVAPYLMLDGHTLGAVQVVITDEAWDSLTPEQQEVVDECGKLAVQYEREINRAGDDEILSRWQSKNGVEVIPYEDLDIDSFKAVVEPVTEWYIGELKKQGYKDAEELVAAFK